MKRPTLSRLIAVWTTVTMLFGCQVLTLMWGWGLEPKSWFWIIGFSLVGTSIVKAIAQEIMDEE